MRSRKRILICILVLAMLLPLGVRAETVTPESAPATEKQQAAVQKLLAFGIYGKEELPDQSKPVTRGDFVRLLCGALGLAEAGSGDVSPFADVVPSGTNAGAIITAYHAGIINGGGDNSFYPEREITLNEAVKMTVTALGYDLYARQAGYPVGYQMQANDLKLLQGVTTKGEEVVDGANACTLLENALEADYLKLVAISNDRNEYETAEDKTWLSELYHIYQIKGQITATGISPLSAVGSKTGRNQVKIGGNLFWAGETAAQEYLGYVVELYYRQKIGDDQGTALYVTPDFSRSQALEVAAKDISDSTTVTSFLYFNENGSQEKVNLGASVDLIYNGVARALDSDLLLKPEGGKVVLLDSNNDGSYDVLFVTSYVTYVVNRVNLNDFAVTDLYGQGNLKLDPSDNTKTIRISVDGKEAALETLSKWTVLSVAADGETIDANGVRHVGTDSVVYSIQGSTLAEIGAASEVSDDSLVINGKSYPLSDYYHYLRGTGAIPDCSTGEVFSFYFNADGELAAVDSENLNSSNYGYLINLDVSSGLEKKVSLKILESTGKISVFPCKKTLKVDGAGGVNAYNPQATGLDLYRRLTSGGNVVNQVIGYGKNTDGEIIVVDTQAQNSGGNDSSDLGYYGHFKDIGYKSSDKTIGEKFAVDNSTVIFSVPDMKTAANQAAWAEDKNFTIANVSKLKNDEKFEFDVYNMQRAKVIQMMVLYGSGGADLDADNYIAVIERVSSVLLEDGETAIKVHGMKDGKLFDAYIKEDSFSLVDYNTRTTKEITGNVYPDTKAEVLSCGDIIRVATDPYGIITDVEMIVDFSAGIDHYQSLQNHGVMSRTIYGLVYDLSRNMAEVVFDSNQLNAAEGTRESAVYALKSVPIMVYNATKKTVRAGTVKDIIAYRDYRDLNSTTRIAMNARYGEIRSIVIYSDLDQ